MTIDGLVQPPTRKGFLDGELHGVKLDLGVENGGHASVFLVRTKKRHCVFLSCAVVATIIRFLLQFGFTSSREDSSSSVRSEELRIVSLDRHSMDSLRTRCKEVLISHEPESLCSRDISHCFDRGTLLGLLPTTAAHVYAGTLAPSSAELMSLGHH